MQVIFTFNYYFYHFKTQAKMDVLGALMNVCNCMADMVIFGNTILLERMQMHELKELMRGLMKS